MCVVGEGELEEYSFDNTKLLIAYCMLCAISYFCFFVYAAPDPGNAHFSKPGTDSSFTVDRTFVFP